MGKNDKFSDVAKKLVKKSSNSGNGEDMERLIQENLALKRKSDFVQGIIDSSRDPQLILDENLNIISANRSYYEKFDTTPEKIEKKSFLSDLNHYRKNTKLQKILHKIAKTGTEFKDFEITISLKKVGERILLLNARSLFVKKKKTKMIILTIEDITERRRVEERLKYLNLMLLTIRNVNQLIVHETDKKKLVEKACGLLEENGVYKSSIIVLKEDDGNYYPVLTNSEKSAPAFKEQIKKKWLPPCGERALKSSEIVIVSSPQNECGNCPFASDYDEWGRIVSRFEYKNNVYGFISVRVEKKYLHDERLISLFKEITGDLAFALYRIELEKKNKETKTKLLESEARFISFMNYFPGAVFIKDKESKYLFINKYYDKIFGTSDWIKGKKTADIFPPKIATSLVKNDKEVLESNKYLIKEEYITLKSGFHRIFETHKFPIITNKGKKLLGGIALDITEQKLAEEKLLILSTAIEQSPSVIAITDLDGNLEYVNPKFIELTGYSEKEVLGKNPRILKSGEQSAEFYENLWNTITSGNTWKGEFRNKKKNGELYWEAASITPIFGKNGKKLHYLKVAEDITEKKNALEKIEQDLREKTVLLREVHHRVKNNLQIMSSLLHLQLNYIQDEKDKDLILNSLSRINTMALVHEKLYQTENYYSINIIDYLCELIAYIERIYSSSYKVDFKYEVKSTKLNINLAIPCGLILNELISNSVKHAFPDERRGTIKVFFRTEGNSYELTVADNGIGLPKEIDIHKPSTMGLLLVNILAKQLKGKMKIERNEGTKISILFSDICLRTFSKL